MVAEHPQPDENRGPGEIHCCLHNSFRITVALNDCFVVSRTVMNTMMLSFMNKFLSCYVNGRKIERMYH